MATPPKIPKPGTPEFLAMVERTKDRIEAETGIRPDVVQVTDPDAVRREERRRRQGR